MTGGTGADAFVFNRELSAATNGDQITDFSVVDDTIHLDNDPYSSGFSTLADGALAASAFHIGSAAADADDRIVYDSASGALLYAWDGNGFGAAVEFSQHLMT